MAQTLSMKRSLIELKFYETYYFAAIVREVLEHGLDADEGKMIGTVGGQRADGAAPALDRLALDDRHRPAVRITRVS